MPARVFIYDRDAAVDHDDKRRPRIKDNPAVHFWIPDPHVFIEIAVILAVVFDRTLIAVCHVLIIRC